MAKNKGIQLNENGDLLIRNGSLSIGNTLYQNQYMILKAQKGELKELPFWGAGIDNIINDDDIQATQRTIREELARDGMKVKQLTIQNNELIIKADYQ